MCNLLGWLCVPHCAGGWQLVGGVWDCIVWWDRVCRWDWVRCLHQRWSHHWCLDPCHCLTVSRISFCELFVLVLYYFQLVLESEHRLCVGCFCNLFIEFGYCVRCRLLSGFQLLFLVWCIVSRFLLWRRSHACFPVFRNFVVSVSYISTLLRGVPRRVFPLFVWFRCPWVLLLLSVVR